ncbi:selenocysteine-specific translation elongation factor [Fredinandcohnia quinoae]|uniref:Selenocysteine-specific elongation factor n=1 Tax=Fredinandcohnia quinoae TaxID=2918902 RepID=A0AAW5E6J7_9BACI|nr:selenocysteine-specific translation elongation factor [Fredinandcohnia sp. SECRCQ15]MCH1625647.1 selenocysteine-specific translation elongation factor [Fredinandcohnia sp. SECRCQ15]
MKYFTIGMAGHIDHGKTSLTKALTGIDTDRLKEEKERNISIELGFAPLAIDDDSIEVSIVDVPGHERFIRQMIAGVAGIDFVILVIAADEGVMPQTKEHVEILSFLKIRRGIIAISKVEQVEEELIELVKEDIIEQFTNTIFEAAPIVLVDSISNKGIDELRKVITDQLINLEERHISGNFRLPIDQVFTVKGHGTVVRGTVYEGSVKEGETLTVLPTSIKVKARKLQVHHKNVQTATAGQRVAINVTGVSKQEITRGDVLVHTTDYTVTQTIDVVLHFVKDLMYPVKQRTIIKFHCGTSEVLGKIVFFDRNEVIISNQEEIVCQIRLEEPITIRRGDRFILRRPSPKETIAGGWIIDPQGEKYRFGMETIQLLQKKKEGNPSDIIFDLLSKDKILSISELMMKTNLTRESVQSVLTSCHFIHVLDESYTNKQVLNDVVKRAISEINEFHQTYPLRQGINKVQVKKSLENDYSEILVNYVLNSLIKTEQIKRDDQYFILPNFTPSFPKHLRKQMEGVIQSIQTDGITVQEWDKYCEQWRLKEKDANELKYYLLGTKQAVQLMDQYIIHSHSVIAAHLKLKAGTDQTFTIKEAKDLLQLSRKFIVPFVELLDDLQYTRRVDDKRVWLNKK